MTSAQTTPMPGEALKPERMPGHWLLARLGKRVLRPGGRQLTCQMIEALNIGPTDAVMPAANDRPEDARPPVLHDRPDEATDKPAAHPDGDDARVGDARAGGALPPGALFRIGSTRLQHGSLIYTLAAAPDGKLLASLGSDGDLSIWELPTGRERHRKSVASSVHGNFLAFTPDAKSLVLNMEGKLTLLDVETGQIRKQFGANQSPGQLSTDGKVLTLVGGPAVRRLDLATGEALSSWQFQKEPPEGFREVAFQRRRQGFSDDCHAAR